MYALNRVADNKIPFRGIKHDVILFLQLVISILQWQWSSFSADSSYNADTATGANPSDNWWASRAVK